MQAPNIETGELVATASGRMAGSRPEQTIITSSCGFNHLPRHIASARCER